MSLAPFAETGRRLREAARTYVEARLASRVRILEFVGESGLLAPARKVSISAAHTIVRSTCPRIEGNTRIIDFRNRENCPLRPP